MADLSHIQYVIEEHALGGHVHAQKFKGPLSRITVLVRGQEVVNKQAPDACHKCSAGKSSRV